MDARTRALMALAKAKAALTDDQDDDHRHDAAFLALLALLTAWFGSQPAIQAVELPAELIARLVAYGFTHRAATEAGRLACRPPLSGRSRYGSPKPSEDMTAVRRVAAEEPEMRARFVVASADRLTEAEADGRFEAQLDAERRYRDAHVAMGRKRRQAAQRAEEVASKSRTGWLVWRTAGDERVEAICRALEGRMFTLDNPPDGLYPGAAHLYCRCHAEPWGGTVPSD